MTKKAERYINNHIALHPNNPAGYFGLGYLHLVQRNWESGLNNFNKVLELDRNILDTYQMKGIIFHSTSRFQEFLDISRTGLNLAEHENDPESKSIFLSNCAVACLNLSDYPGALEYFGQALKLNQEF